MRPDEHDRRAARLHVEVFGPVAVATLPDARYLYDSRPGLVAGLGDALARRGVASLVLSIAAARVLSSAAIAAIFLMERRAAERGGKVLVAHAAAPVAEVFRVTNLSRLLRPDVPTALAELSEEAARLHAARSA